MVYNYQMSPRLRIGANPPYIIPRVIFPMPLLIIRQTPTLVVITPGCSFVHTFKKETVFIYLCRPKNGPVVH